MTSWGRGSAGKLVRRLRRSEIAALAGDSFWVSIWQGSTNVAELVQVALITHMLGLEEYGRYALVIAFATLVGGIFKVRVSYTAIAFGADALRRDRREAAGIFQLTFLIDLLTAIVGFLVIMALAPFVGGDLTDGAGTGLIALAALTLVASGADETCTSVLRLVDRFRLVAVYGAATEVLRIGLVLAAVLIYESLAAVVVALIIAKLARGAIGTVVAVRAFNHDSSDDVSLTTPCLRRIRREDRKPMLKMMFHTNFTTYGRAGQAQLPTLILGATTGAVEVAVYKVGTAAAMALARFVDPASAALLPRVAKAWARGRMKHVRRLVRNASLISVPAMVVLLAILVGLQEPILELIGGKDAVDEAGPVLVMAGIAQASYGVVFWHTTLLFAARRAATVTAVTLVAAALQVGLVALLVPRYGATGAAVSLLVVAVLSNAVLTVMALRMLRWQESRQPVA